MILQALSLTTQQAQNINHAIDGIHALFPFLSIFAISVLFESFLPVKTAFKNSFDKWYTYFKLPFLALLNFIALSQALLGGCVIYYPQKWFNHKYFGYDEPYQFGLFGRQYINQDYLWALRLLFILGSAIIVWRTWEFVCRRVMVKNNLIQGSNQPHHLNQAKVA